jgi:hypothetical protein
MNIMKTNPTLQGSAPMLPLLKRAPRGSVQEVHLGALFLNASFEERFLGACSQDTLSMLSGHSLNTPWSLPHDEADSSSLLGVWEPIHGSRWLQNGWLGFVRIKTLTHSIFFSFYFSFHSSLLGGF